MNLFKKENLRIMVLTLLVILSVAQTFKTIDPISKVAFGTSNFGKHQILNINPADGLVYNCEFTVIDKLINKMNKEIQISEDSTILLGEVEWVSHFNGTGQIYIDRFSFERTFKTENTFRPEIYSIWDLSSYSGPDEAYYVYLWFGDEMAELEQVKKYYRVLETKKIDHQGYSFTLYKLERLAK